MSVPSRLRAPRQDRAIVANPPLSETAALLVANRRRLAEPPLEILGRPLLRLRQQARDSALAAARAYLLQCGEPLPALTGASWLVAGHQPELFHPGVWVKNFALNGLARAHQGVALNLIVDTDTAKSAVLRLPTRTSGWPRVVALPLDRWSLEAPFEERTVRDEPLFLNLAERALPLLQVWGYEPMLADFWAEMRRQARRTPLLGERLVAARRAWERRWGCHNLEVPVSLLCQTEPFAWFACQVLHDLPRFHACYNESVGAYRLVHGLRSRNHPVPDLAEEDGWLEAPFWAWRAGSARRERLFARNAPGGIDLRIGAQALSLGPADDIERLVTAWQDLQRQGWKLRSRALTTTLFARLFLADVFMHGLGGGLYDEVTDAIVRSFYGIEPPGFLVLSATLLLPLPAYPVSPQDCQRLARELRDVQWNPQRHLGDAPPEALALAAEKTAWIKRETATAGQRRERFQMLQALTRRLRGYLAEREGELGRRLDQCRRQAQANAILQRRDYAFCLYPEAELWSFCTQFLTQAEPALRPTRSETP